MDGLRRKVLTARPLRLTLIAFALLLAVAAGSRLGGSAQEGATPGASPEASPAASPVASPVAEIAEESGSITIRVLGCDAGTTADTIDASVCRELAGDVDIEIGGAGDPVTVDDSLRLSAGVFRWQRLPFDTYSLTLASLPEGYTAALAATDPAATPEEISADGFEVSLDAAESSPTVTIYLIP